jgi:hypothetical protein
MARASSKGSAHPVVTFEGPPELLEAHVAVNPLRRNQIRVSTRVGRTLTAVRALTAPAGDQTLVRLVFGSTTPPGEISAVVEVGDEQFDAIIRTTSHTELDCAPTALDLELEGTGTRATVRVVNIGNTPVDLGDTSLFGLMSDRGVDTAIGSGLMSAETGLDRFGRFADRLAELHGGLLKATITSGGGSLEPGIATTIEAVIEPIEQLPAGRRYHGTWPLATLRIPVRVTTPGAST